MICSKCGLDKDQSEYKVIVKPNKTDKVYTHKQCNTCLKEYSRNYYKGNKLEIIKSVKLRKLNKVKGRSTSRKSKVLITPDDIDNFIKKVKRQANYIDVVDAYRLTHIYTFIYGIECNENISVEDQLILMWDKLKKYEFNV